MKIIATLLLAALFIGSMQSATNPPPRYRLQRVEGFVDYDGFADLLLNNRDEITAMVHDEDGTPRLFLRGRKKTVELPLPAGTSGGLNLAGCAPHKTILFHDQGAYSAYRYCQGKMFNLTNFLPYDHFNVVAMNERGHLVGGASRDGDPVVTAFSYYRGRHRKLPTLWPDASSIAFAANKRGQIVGGTQDKTVLGDAVVGTIRAVIFKKHEAERLGTLPGGTSSLAIGINDRGTVIGYANVQEPVEEGSDSFRRGFVYRKGSMQQLRPLPGHLRSQPNDINKRDQIVGQSTNEDWDTRAVLFQNGLTYDLSELIPSESHIELSDALSINDRGVIVAINDSGESFLLFPLPIRPPGPHPDASILSPDSP